MHAETYARFLLELVAEEGELRRLFGAIHTIPTVKDKADWTLKWFSADKYSFATRVIAFAIVEGIFFSSSFAAIFWVRSRGLLPGLCHSNELIMRDEGLHMDFACRLYGVLRERVPGDVVVTMISDAVHLEQRFFTGLSVALSPITTLIYMVRSLTSWTSWPQRAAHESVRGVRSRFFAQQTGLWSRIPQQ